MSNRIAAMASLFLLGSSPSGIHAAKFRVLDFWGIGGYAHTSRVTANTYLDSLSMVMDFQIVKTEDVKSFTKENLAQYQVVVRSAPMAQASPR